VLSRPGYHSSARRTDSLQESGVHPILKERQWTTRLPDLIAEFVAHTQIEKGLSEAG
jgi:hypothetical protein